MGRLILPHAVMAPPDSRPVPPKAVVQGDGFHEKSAAYAKTWLDARKRELELIEGCNWFRVSWDEREGVLLIEGWEYQPVALPKPAWQTVGKEI